MLDVLIVDKVIQFCPNDKNLDKEREGEWNRAPFYPSCEEFKMEHGKEIHKDKGKK